MGSIAANAIVFDRSATRCDTKDAVWHPSTNLSLPAHPRCMANPDTEALLRARLFQSSNPDIARRLAAIRPRAKNVGGGEMVFEANDPADCIYLLAGQVGAGER